MKKSEKRIYQSDIRQQRALETRKHIASTARKLFISNGYDGTTIDVIASEAGVATQTIYAVFTSKKGILAEILDQARFGPEYLELVSQANELSKPNDLLRLAARICRKIYDSERAEAALLQGASVVSPDIAKMGKDNETRRYKAQHHSIKVIVESRKLRDELDEKKARDILWTFTSREMFSMLVIERGWNLSDYEKWLGDTLIRTLLK